MNPTGKKFLSLFLVFSLLALSGNLYAKKRGAEILIVKKDGRHIMMELIAVKQNSLLLEGGISVDIKDVKIVRIKERSKFWKGAGTGALIGMVTGALWGASVGENDLFSVGLTVLVDGILLSALGFLIGGMIGARKKGGYKTIQIEGKSDFEINKVLKKLRKKARVRDYK